MKRKGITIFRFNKFLFVFVLSGLFLFFCRSVLAESTAAKEITYPQIAFGAKFYYFLPGVGGQYVISENYAVEGLIGPYGMGNSGVMFYEANLLVNKRVGKLNPFLGLGLFSSKSWGTDSAGTEDLMYNLRLGLIFKNECFSFMPALQFLIKDSSYTTMPTMGLFWFI